MKKKYLLIIILIFSFFFIPKNAYALDSIQLSSSNGTVLYSGGLNCDLVNVSNVKYVIFKFDLDISSNSKYNLDWQFSYSTQGSAYGLHLDWLIIGDRQFHNPTNTWTTLNQTALNNFYHLQYINHTPFDSALNGKYQSQLTYSFDNPVFLGTICFEDKRLQYLGSLSGDTNDAINAGVNNIITNNNTNTDRLIEEEKKTQDEIRKQTEEQKKTNDTLKDTDTTSSEHKAKGFFDNFQDDNYGLSDIITIPLDFIKGLSNNKCNNLNIPIPFVNQTVSLPCMTSIYEKYASDFLILYQTITTGFIAYWVCVNIFAMVQGFKSPDSDNVEVLDL